MSNKSLTLIKYCQNNIKILQTPIKHNIKNSNNIIKKTNWKNSHLYKMITNYKQKDSDIFLL
jgi:hypothetical protein